MCDNIPIVSKRCCRILPISEIVYIISDYRKAEIHTMTEMIKVYYTRDEIISYLDGRFDHCLKTLIINFEMVKGMENGTIRFFNGEQVSLGRGSFIRTKQKFAMFVKNNKKTLAKTAVL